jgi:hypothetical protein
MTERAYFDQSLGVNADEHLEIIFKQVFEENTAGDEGKAIAVLINPYCQTLFGDAALSFDGALESIERAMRWSCQFGDIRFFTVSPSARAAQPELEFKDKAFGATIDHPIGGSAVLGKTVHQTILLAGIQVLREIAYATLNRHGNEAPH